MLQRIMDRKSEYRKSDFDRDWVAKLHHMDRIAAYPPNWWEQVGSTQVKIIFFKFSF